MNKPPIIFVIGNKGIKSTLKLTDRIPDKIIRQSSILPLIKGFIDRYLIMMLFVFITISFRFIPVQFHTTPFFFMHAIHITNLSRDYTLFSSDNHLPFLPKAHPADSEYFEYLGCSHGYTFPLSSNFYAPGVPGCTGDQCHFPTDVWQNCVAGNEYLHFS